MALTTIPSELSSVSGIADSSDATAITISSQENVGIGVVPKTWHSGWEALQIGERAAFFSQASTTTGIGENVYYNSGWKAIATAVGSLYQQDSGNHHFYTMASVSADATSSPSEKFTILNNGKVGIGTTSPTELLEVNSTGATTAIEVSAGAASTTTGEAKIVLRSLHSASGTVYSRSEIASLGVAGGDSDLIFRTTTDTNGPQERMRIKDTGYVGIGETSPDNKLHITGGDWNNAHIRIERTDNGASNDPGLVFKSAAGANDAYGLGSMWFQNALDGNAYAMIRARTDDASGTSGKLEFVTSTSAVGNGTTPALTIDSNQIPVFRQGSYESEIHNHSWAATLETRTSDGSDNYGVGLDAGGGAGSNSRGAGLWCYGNENTSYPASIVAQVGSGGLFRIFAGTTGGSEALQVDASGHLLPGSDSTKNLGSTSKRWDILYVNDMHFSNEGSDGNDVDGTTGDWTLQEGEEHLYIINNKSGKKFKFSLEEVG